MKNFTIDKVIRDTKEMLKRCGIEIYIIQFMMIASVLYETYKSYKIYPNEYVNTSIGGFITTTLQMLITTMLTIIVITIINNKYENIEYSYNDILTSSVKKLPRYILGLIKVGGIMIVGFIIYNIIMIFLHNFVGFIISTIVFAIAMLYILMRFCLMNYILVLEKGTGLIARSKAFYEKDKSLIIKYFFISILTGITPLLIFVFLPDWIGIEISKPVFLITRVTIHLLGFILTPIFNIVGLLIYKQYNVEDNDGIVKSDIV